MSHNDLEQQIQKALQQAFQAADLPLPGKQSGKVRDWYALPGGRRLLVTTDRLSAFDRVLAAVPFKGQVLNELSAWWFERTKDIVGNHALSIPDPNALVAQEAKPYPVEVVVRGYISGVTSTSLWQQYAQGNRTIYGYTLPDGLKKNQALPEPIITPTTKATTGHDQPLTVAEVSQTGLVEERTWKRIQEAALAVFARGQQLARDGGLILVDTKYEFGEAPDGSIMLIDEVHTPDSSRYWNAANYQERVNAGQEPENLDKEFVRLAYAERNYKGDGEPPVLPATFWASASRRYITMYEKLTGRSFSPGQYPVNPRLVDNLKRVDICK